MLLCFCHFLLGFDETIAHNDWARRIMNDPGFKQHLCNINNQKGNSIHQPNPSDIGTRYPVRKRSNETADRCRSKDRSNQIFRRCRLPKERSGASAKDHELSCQDEVEPNETSGFASAHLKREIATVVAFDDKKHYKRQHCVDDAKEERDQDQFRSLGKLGLGSGLSIVVSHRNHALLIRREVYVSAVG